MGLALLKLGYLLLVKVNTFVDIDESLGSEEVFGSFGQPPSLAHRCLPVHHLVAWSRTTAVLADSRYRRGGCGRTEKRRRWGDVSATHWCPDWQRWQTKISS